MFVYRFYNIYLSYCNVREAQNFEEAYKCLVKGVTEADF